MKTIVLIVTMIVAAQGFASERLSTQCFETTTGGSGPNQRVDIYQNIETDEFRSEVIRVNGATESHDADNMPCSFREDGEGILQCQQSFEEGTYTFVIVVGADQAVLRFDDNRNWQYSYESFFDCAPTL